MFEWFKKQPLRGIDELKVSLSRDELIRKSRILFIDDERPDLIEDLKKVRFSVDYESDITKDNIQLLEDPVHDLFIVDFAGVGGTLGKEQGLSILRHIKRVNPASVTMAYTSKSIRPEYSDFYLKADAVLQKDAGIQESTEKIESALRLSYRVDRLWSGIIQIADITSGSEQDRSLQDRFVRSLSTQTTSQFKTEYAELCQKVGASFGAIVIEKLIKVAVTTIAGSV